MDLLVAWWLEPKLDDIVRLVFSHAMPFQSSLAPNSVTVTTVTNQCHATASATVVASNGYQQPRETWLLACRPLLARTLESLQPGWQHHPSLGTVLLTRLLQDLHNTVADWMAGTAESHKRFLRLISCIDAVVNGCMQRVGIDLSGKKGHSSMLPFPHHFAAKSTF